MQFARTFRAFVPLCNIIVDRIKVTKTVHKSLPEILPAILLCVGISL